MKLNQSIQYIIFILYYSYFCQSRIKRSETPTHARTHILLFSLFVLQNEKSLTKGNTPCMMCPPHSNKNKKKQLIMQQLYLSPSLSLSQSPTSSTSTVHTCTILLKINTATTFFLHTSFSLFFHSIHFRHLTQPFSHIPNLRPRICRL